jgi:hypothetical protein
MKAVNRELQIVNRGHGPLGFVPIGRRDPEHTKGPYGPRFMIHEFHGRRPETTPRSAPYKESE